MLTGVGIYFIPSSGERVARRSWAIRTQQSSFLWQTWNDQSKGYSESAPVYRSDPSIPAISHKYVLCSYVCFVIENRKTNFTRWPSPQSMPSGSTATGTTDLNAINDIGCGMARILLRLVWPSSSLSRMLAKKTSGEYLSSTSFSTMVFSGSAFVDGCYK